MRIFNTSIRYGLVAIILHWLMAILLIILILLGLYMTRIPISMLKLKLYGWHKELGFLAMLLVLIRLAWRMANQTPLFPAVMPLWEKFAARLTHWTFYFLMLLLPISGWLLTSAAGLSASFFGLFVVPDLISANEASRWIFTQVHHWLGYILIALLCLHILAALKHHFIDKDDILRRMI